MQSPALRAVAGAFLSLVFSGYALAGATGGYVSLGGGASFLSDADYDTEIQTSGGLLGNTSMTVDADFEAEYDTGYLGSFALGYIDGGLRGELEFRYSENDFESVSGFGGASAADGKINSKALMLNAYYDFNRPGRFHPYVGLGVGSAEIEVEDLGLAGSGNNGRISGEDTVFAFQGATGIAFDITPRFTVDLGYRYFQAVDPQFRDGPVDTEFEYEQHAALLSLRYVFYPTGGIDSDGDGVFDESDQCPDTPRGVSVDGSGCPLDTDGDGVPDFKDKCPGTPSGVSVDDKGCPLDSDGDGVTDDKDECPNTPKGTPVNAKGCPRDTDGDGVLDAKDDCPGTPEGAKVTANGCAVQQKFVLEGVKYEFDSAKLTAQAEGILNETAATLKESPGFRIQLSGHTDSKGSDSYNLKLSQARAESAREYLVSQGVDGSRIKAVGFGESRPIAPNTEPDGTDNPEGRAKNRRTEIKIIGE